MTFLVVASYNVHQCIGGDRRRDVKRIGAVLQELQADVIALQEIECGHHDDGNALELLATTLGYRAVAGPIREDHRRGFGNALLTRVPVGEVRNHNLSVPGREAHAALDVVLHPAHDRVRVLSTHLGLARDERRQQVAQLVRILDEDKDAISLLLGDFNEWRRSDKSLRPLAQRMGAAPRARSFPARMPAFCLDRVFAMPAGTLLHLRTHSSRLARAASDHLPVVAAIALDRIVPPAAK